MIRKLLKKYFNYELPQTATAPFCPSEVEGTVYIDSKLSQVKQFLVCAGSGLLVAVGYMDPGNWATDIQAGSQFGYALLFVVFLSSLIAMFLQVQCVKLGMVTGKDLAQLSRDRYSKNWNYILWFFAEISIVACDVAEVLGTAIAFQLLFHFTMEIAILATALDTVFILALQGKGIKRLEAIILGLILTIAVCFGVEVFFSHPNFGLVAKGMLPPFSLASNKDAWILAIGILGATVMPHNLYLHTSLVQTRKTDDGEAQKNALIRLTVFDTVVSLLIAFFVNAAILIVAGSLFYFSGKTKIYEIQDAYRLLEPILGTSLAAILFGIALFASGQSSTITGTIAGQVVMEGFLKLNIPCWQRRLITRSLAIMPAWIGIHWWGEGVAGKMLILSQVVLSFQLPFAIFPLLQFVGDRKQMGAWVLSNKGKVLGWILFGLITIANLWLVMDFFR